MTRLIALYIVFFVFQTSVYSQSVLLKGKFFNIKDDAEICLISYESDNEVFKSKIIDKNVLIVISDSIQEGVYKLLVVGYKNNEKLISNEFDVIINKKDRLIEFEIDLKSDGFPRFINSIANIEWYSYKISEKKILDELMFFKDDYEQRNYVDKKLQEFKILRENYFLKTNDYWLKLMIKNTGFLTQNKIKLIEKELYWKYVEINDKKVLNSPLLVNSIRNFIIQYYAPSSKLAQINLINNYKEGFTFILDEFLNSNKEVYLWLKKYIYKGVLELENTELIQFFKNRCLN